MLSELQRLHDELLASISELESCTAQSTPDRVALAKVRLKLSRASTRRHRFIEDKVYPHLLSGAGPEAAAKVEQLKTVNAALRAESTRHVGRWSVDQIVQDWAGYRSASSDMQKSMRQRIAAEKDLLYPLLIPRTAGKSSRAT